MTILSKNIDLQPAKRSLVWAVLIVVISVVLSRLISPMLPSFYDPEPQGIFVVTTNVGYVIVLIGFIIERMTLVATLCIPILLFLIVVLEAVSVRRLYVLKSVLYFLWIIGHYCLVRTTDFSNITHVVAVLIPIFFSIIVKSCVHVMMLQDC